MEITLVLAYPRPQGGARCLGLGLPWCSPAALLLAGAAGQGPAARPCPDRPHGELSWPPGEPLAPAAP